MLREDVDIEHIQLHVRKSNKAALSLYKKLGYQIVRDDKKYYADEEDAFIMQLLLSEPQERPRSVFYSLQRVFLTYGTRMM
ncbi:hypothetical protein J3R82DRAFT_10860 [Butyriboletus roseoflavus]|nr:hypothetical protein J3R82DRAFT_10860 [Butyriboletus roseoflavus]